MYCALAEGRDKGPFADARRWRWGDDRVRVRVLTCDPLLCGPILESLPPMLKVNIRTDRSGQWLEQSIVHLVEEAASDRAGSDVMLAKLSEVLFVDTIRRYVAGLPDQTTGWLAGARDPVVGKSLALLHSPPESPVDDRRVRPGRRPVSLRARGAFHALPLGSPYRVFDRLAAASGGRGVDVHPEGSGGYRGRCGLRV